MVSELKKALEVFISYSHKDQDLRDQLETQLSPLKKEGIISSWYDRKIIAGAEWAREIDEHLNTAQIILLLISADFIASTYCYDIEVKRAMERHYTGEACVIPVILRYCDWHHALFGKLQALPTDGKPVDSQNWYNKDEALHNIIQGIRKAAEDIQALKTSTKPQKGRSEDFSRTDEKITLQKPKLNKAFNLSEQAEKESTQPELDLPPIPEGGRSEYGFYYTRVVTREIDKKRENRFIEKEFVLSSSSTNKHVVKAHFTRGYEWAWSPPDFMLTVRVDGDLITKQHLKLKFGQVNEEVTTYLPDYRESIIRNGLTYSIEYRIKGECTLEAKINAANFLDPSHSWRYEVSRFEVSVEGYTLLDSSSLWD